MFRDEGAIYVDGKEYTRPPKHSKEMQELKDQLAYYHKRLTYYQNMHTSSEKVKQEKLDEIQLYINVLKEDIDELRKHEPVHSHKVIKTHRKVSPEKIREAIIKEINNQRINGGRYISAEDIAFNLRCKVHFVKQVLQKMNAEGIVSQPHHRIPHDSDRDPWCNGNYSGWQSDVYIILERNDDV